MKSIRTVILSFVGSILFTTFPCLLCADQATMQLPASNPAVWFTGPLLAPTGTVVTKGHYTFQPYLFLGAVTGAYNSHWKPAAEHNFYNVTLQFETQIGLTEFMDIQTIPQILYNASQDQSSTRFGDLPIILDFQLINAEKFKWFPGIKLELTETFPTGKYQKLNPKKLDTDVSGLGSFSTTPGLVFYKIYPISGHHFLSMTASVQYTYFAPVHVKGLNVYEGGRGTCGKVYPGNLITAFLSFEYALTQNWVFSLDNVYNHEDKDRFRGNPGMDAAGIPSIVGRPSSELLSFAPAIEYNFSEHLGLIAGIWFSAIGRNTSEFCNGVISFMFAY